MWTSVGESGLLGSIAQPAIRLGVDISTSPSGYLQRKGSIYEQTNFGRKRIFEFLFSRPNRVTVKTHSRTLNRATIYSPILLGYRQQV